MKKILLIGSAGMFGKDAEKFFGVEGHEVIKAGRQDFDITNLKAVENFFCGKSFDLVINAAAYTKVDDAELHREEAFAVNAEGAKNIAIVTAAAKIPLIFISTDYVFDGTKNSPYLPGDKTNPQTVYGASKCLGEENVRAINPCHYIVRTSWLYGKNGKNFVDTMLNLAKNQTVIKVVNDQFGCPTSTLDLANGIMHLLEKNQPFGTYHICGSGVTSWFDFAKKIFEIAKIEVAVLPVATAEFPRLALRPKFSAMDNDGLCNHWVDSLQKYLKTTNRI